MMRNKKIIYIILVLIIALFVLLFIHGKLKETQLIIGHRLEDTLSFEFNDVTYSFIGITSKEFAEERIGIIKNDSSYGKYFIYAVGTDQNFLIVENRLAGEITYSLYANQSIQETPYDYMLNGLTNQHREIVIDGVSFYFYSSTPSEFSPGDEIGVFQEKLNVIPYFEPGHIPYPADTLVVFTIPGVDESQWVAAQAIGTSDNYRIYCVDNDTIDVIPAELLFFLSEYPGEQYYGTCSISYDGDTQVPYKVLVNNLENPYDDKGHSTAAAGIIAGIGTQTNGDEVSPWSA